MYSMQQIDILPSRSSRVRAHSSSMGMKEVHPWAESAFQRGTIGNRTGQERNSLASLASLSASVKTVDDDLRASREGSIVSCVAGDCRRRGRQIVRTRRLASWWRVLLLCQLRTVLPVTQLWCCSSQTLLSLRDRRAASREWKITWYGLKGQRMI